MTFAMRDTVGCTFYEIRSDSGGLVRGLPSFWLCALLRRLVGYEMRWPAYRAAALLRRGESLWFGRDDGPSFQLTRSK